MYINPGVWDGESVLRNAGFMYVGRARDSEPA